MCEDTNHGQHERHENERVIDPGRRGALMKGLFGAGMLGLRALATGIPAAILANPRRALAADPYATGCFSEAKAQYLILSTSGSGDPLNANVPGTYAYP